MNWKINNVYKLIAFFCTFYLWGQSITVNTNSHTPAQLVNQVLVNQTCIAQINNISTRTGTNFGSTNGIAYFTNTNPNFPFSDGVLLTTGDAIQSPGYTTTPLNAGTLAWTGDTDLEQVMTNAGLPMNGTNATVLEFDFSTIKNSLSLDFMFMSEEYATYQCNARDAIAILLTNTQNNVTQNLAVIPTTTIPISVATIRDNTYNSLCNSQNASFFGALNGCVGAVCPPTNYNGQTVVFNASATIVPNVTYHIKFVIADSTDEKFDSALFLHRLNLGEYLLGDDLLISTDTALCVGESYTIQSGLDPTFFTFQWANSLGNLVGETNPNLTINTAGTYTLTYTNIATGCSFSDSIIIENYPEAPITQPQNLSFCDTGATQYSYNLEANTPVILGTLNASDYTITYHPTLLEAQNNTNILASPYLATPPATIYVRIVTNATGCVTFRTFDLVVFPPPTAHQPNNLTACESSFGIATNIFDLTTQNNDILNGQTGLGISYHYSLTDAQSGNNAITTTTNFVTGNVTIYVRVYRLSDTTCFDTTSFTITVNPLMPIITKPNLQVCSAYVLPALPAPYEYHLLPAGGDVAIAPGTSIPGNTTVYIFNPNPTNPECYGQSSFLIDLLEPNDFNYQDVTQCAPYTVPNPEYGEFYDAPNGTGNIIPAGTILDLGTVTTLYFYYQSPNDPTCIFTNEHTVTVLEEVLVDTHPSILSCDPYDGNDATIGLYPLTNGAYYTATGGPTGTGTLLTAPYPIFTSDTTLYIYNNPTDFEECEQETSFSINIITASDLPPQNIDACLFYNLPSLYPLGNFYTEANGQGTLLPVGTTITTSQTIYYYINTNYGVNCTVNYPITINILPPLPVDDLPDVITCDTYFLPAITNGSYYSGMNGTGTQYPIGHPVNSTQTIYIYNTSSGANCASQTDFVVTFPQMPANISVCDSYTLTTPPSVGGYFYSPNGVNPVTLPATFTSNTNIYYYAETTNGTNCFTNASFTITVNHPPVIVFDDQINFCDSTVIPAYPNGQFWTGHNGTGTLVTTGQTITTDTNLYLYVSSGTSPPCYSEKPVFFNNDRPVFEPRDKIISCDGQYVLTPLTVGNYYTASGGPNGTGIMLSPTGNTPGTDYIITTNATIWVYAESAFVPGCFNEISFELEIDDLITQNIPADITTCASYKLPERTDTKEKYYTGAYGTTPRVELPYGTDIATLGLNTPHTIYLYEEKIIRFEVCYEEIPFTITVNSIPIVDTPANVIACNSYSLPPLTNGKYYTQPNGGGQEILANTVITQTQTIYVFNENPLNENCTNQHRFTVNIYPTQPPAIVGGTLCRNLQNGQFVGNYILDTQLSLMHYTFKWYKDGVLLPFTSNTLAASQTGLYGVVATHIITGCVSDMITAYVIDSSMPLFQSYYISNSFTNNQSITVQVTGFSTHFQYRIDGGAWQDESIFQNVAPGIHLVEVKDFFGCGMISQLISTLNYPKFFTPNGDGYNELWHIIGKDGQPNLKVHIFDRYGKFIKELTQKDAGWDGTLNGKPLFANDYWFKVYYEENGIAKEFSSHFSLIR